MKKILGVTSLLVIMILGSCVTSPDYPIEPQIEFIGFSKSELEQGSLNNDSLIMVISFTDGDGDLGSPPETAEKNLFVVDNRTGEIYNSFKTPEIPEEGVGNGVSGEIRVLMFTTCCIFPDNIPPCESPDLYPSNEISFDVHIVDRAGNESNIITTPLITLLCD
ncbi:MAG: hypothetical protein HKN68_15680 [Saprospiraceae bacterium]|nr:hypothetical protein [Saprospiraceae bacterium]